MKGPLKRLPDWPDRFARYLLARHATPFEWGKHDCCQFARGNALAITGRDVACGLGIRPYKTANGALRQLQRVGGIEQLPVRAGLTEVPLAYAQRGDLALGMFGFDGRGALGVVVGDKVAFAGPAGLEFRALLECRKAWRI